MTNVVHMSVSLLDKLGDELRDLLQVREPANKAEFVEINIKLCTTLVQARDQFTADIEFGRWCDKNGLGKDVLNPHKKAAAIAMGRDPKALRACLEATDSTSLRFIYEGEFSRYGRSAIPTKNRRSKQKVKSTRKTVRRTGPTPEVERALAQAILDDGKTLEKAIKEFGVTSVTHAKLAVAREEGRREVLGTAESVKLERQLAVVEDDGFEYDPALWGGQAKPSKKARPSQETKSKPHVPVSPNPVKPPLTQQEIDPEFTGTAVEWTDKYGHVQVKTAEQYATMRFADWVSNARALVKRWRELPELRDVDHNWLRSPKDSDIAKLTEALDYLRPRVAELEALLVRATAAVAMKKAASK